MVKKNFVELIYLISGVFFVAWTFSNFLAHCESFYNFGVHSTF